MLSCERIQSGPPVSRGFALIGTRYAVAMKIQRGATPVNLPRAETCGKRIASRAVSGGTALMEATSKRAWSDWALIAGAWISPMTTGPVMAASPAPATASLRAAPIFWVILLVIMALILVFKSAPVTPARHASDDSVELAGVQDSFRVNLWRVSKPQNLFIASPLP